MSLLLNFIDPRNDWNAREADYNRIEAERESYVRVATELRDEAAIRVATASVQELRNVRGAWRDVRAPFEQAVEAWIAAKAEADVAQAVHAAGSTNRKAALAAHENLIVAEAKVRYYAGQIPTLLASCEGTRGRLSREAHVAVGSRVIVETLDLVRKLFEYKSLKGVLTAAADAGRSLNAEAAAWLPIAEELARRAFAERLPRETEARDLETSVQTPHGRLHDYRREEPWMPSADDLEKVLARRREGFDLEKRRLAAELQKLTGQLADLGGAQ